MMTVETRHDPEHELIWITVAGQLTTERKHHLRTSISKALVACPRAVVVDLTDFDDPTGTAAPLFRAAQDRAASDYGVILLWVTPARGQLRERLFSPFWHRRLRLYGDRAQAEVAAHHGAPPPDRFRLTLQPDAFAGSRARLLVQDACAAWAVPQIATAARRVVFELVFNAVLYAGTEVTVTVSRRGAYLHLAVRDGDRRPPTVLPAARRPHPDQPGQPGDGLRIVARTATAWGYLRDPAGKTVWAALRLPGTDA
ncbi:ATP-binding protein [Dactylosporangium sp. CA-233914]|uniref:ATP-binding protein n=1 Tax=Dactylosporangium sp. CA-233914 TaxID=3239934 RepID=UPI003D91486C